MRTAKLICTLSLLVLLLPACGGDSNGTPVVTVSGDATVGLGTQSQLTAKTTNGVDTAYIWTSTNPVVAQVDATGMVTGLAAGEAMIKATGNQTGAVGAFPVVVSADPSQGLPHYDEWVQSPHNDFTAEAFRHWDADGEVQASCARCHSTPGFQNHVNGDPAVPVPLGSTVECTACHNETTEMMDSVIFPSGVEIKGLGREAVCMTCHQGRSSKDDVDATVAGVGEDTAMPGQRFINVHYFPAAATRYGGQVRGGYMYDSESYDVYFQHVPGLDRCQDCHNPHTLEIQLTACSGCHNVSTKADLHHIRMESSLTRDYDGDGDLIEGLWFEIQGLRAKLLQAIQEYAEEVTGTGIVYGEHDYPYWFKDNNPANRMPDAAEVNFGNQFTGFTPRLIKATYNFQYATKDPGGFAHNGKFIIQLLHDSINDLNTQVTNKVDMSNAVRNDRGHFNGTHEAFRHWDDDGEVQASCVRCHSGSFGYEEYLTYKATTPQHIANGMDCATCHTTFDTFDLRRIAQVEFPGGMMTRNLDNPDGNNQTNDAIPTDHPEVQSNICLTCHQGRVSKADIDGAIGGARGGTSLSFMNVHYLAAGATLFGTEAKVGYEYDVWQGISGKAGTVINSPVHRHSDGDKVFLRGGNLPAPLVEQAFYWVRDRTANTFNLAATMGGAAIVLTGDGVGEISLDGAVPKTYEGKFAHFGGGSNNCVFCHNPKRNQHTFRPEDLVNDNQTGECITCHTEIDLNKAKEDQIHDIRFNRTDDYDGDGNVTESLADEVATLSDALWTAMRNHATGQAVGSEGQARAQDAIAYDAHAYPYFMKDNGNPPGSGNRYQDWDGKLLRAAHNYQHSLKEPGAWAHNFHYIMQLLHDSIEDLGGNVSGYNVKDR